MLTDSIMPDEPLLVPVTPGALLLRLKEVQGGLRRHPEIATGMPGGTLDLMESCCQMLLQAAEAGAPSERRQAFAAGQQCLRSVFNSVPSSQGANLFLTDLGLAPCETDEPPALVDITSVLATYTCPLRQMLTTLAFTDAPGATAYWLHEVRFLGPERVEDAIVESFYPVFPRLRLAVGKHCFRIESRNSSASSVSGDFEVEVPGISA